MSSQKAPEKEWLSTVEVAVRLGCSTARVYKIVKEGGLQAFSVPGKRSRVFRAVDVEAYLQPRPVPVTRVAS